MPLKKSASYIILKVTKEIPKMFDSSRLGRIIELLSTEIKASQDNIYNKVLDKFFNGNKDAKTCDIINLKI